MENSTENRSTWEPINQGRKNVFLVGPLPDPIGGVSSHIARLSAYLVNKGIRCTVVDAYPSKKKESVPGVNHLICPGGGAMRCMLWMLYVVGLGRCDIVHFHFSQIAGKFIVLSFLLMKRRRKIILTLHHGDQSAVLRKAVWPMRLMALAALRRMDKIVALSNEQESFYLSLGIPSDRLERWDVALPLTVIPDPALLPYEIQELNPIEEGGEETILMTSGSPTDIYGYEDCIELLDILSEQISCSLIVCLYGKGSNQPYEKKIRTRLSQHPKIIVVDALPAKGFLALLEKVSVYLRPSKVDSFGLAIADALDLGTPCLASDVCIRDPRCEVYPVNDTETFINQAVKLVKQGRERRTKKIIDEINPLRYEVILQCYR